MAFALAFAVQLNAAFVANADENFDAEVSINAMNSYVEEVLPLYLSSRDLPYDNTYSFSSPFIINFTSFQNDSDYYYFVFQDNDVIGKILVSEENGEFYSSFDMNVPKELQNYYDNSSDIYISVEGDTTWVVSEDDCTPLENESDVEYSGYRYQGSAIDKYETVDYSAPLLRRSTQLADIKLSSFPTVRNEKVNGKYVLCWAACIAMSVNYLQDDNLTAMDVYKEIGSPAKPEGYSSNINKAFAAYNLSKTKYSSALTPNQVYQSLKNDKPVFVDVEATDKSMAHALEVFGITISNDKTVYTFMDPSILTGDAARSVIATGNPSTASTTFKYVHTYDGVSYTMTWRSAILIN